MGPFKPPRPPPIKPLCIINMLPRSLRVAVNWAPIMASAVSLSTAMKTIPISMNFSSEFSVRRGKVTSHVYLRQTFRKIHFLSNSFSFDFEPNEISYGSKSKRNFSRRSYSIQIDRKFIFRSKKLWRYFQHPFSQPNRNFCVNLKYLKKNNRCK